MTTDTHTLTEHLADHCEWAADAGYPEPRPLLASWTWDYPDDYVRDRASERETERRLESDLQRWLWDDLEVYEMWRPGPNEEPPVRVAVTVRMVPGYGPPGVSTHVDMPDNWDDDTREDEVWDQIHNAVEDAVYPRCIPILPGRPLRNGGAP